MSGAFDNQSGEPLGGQNTSLEVPSLPDFQTSDNSESAAERRQKATCPGPLLTDLQEEGWTE